MKTDRQISKSEWQYVSTLERHVHVLEDNLEQFKKNEIIYTKAIKALEEKIELLKSKKLPEKKQKAPEPAVYQTVKSGESAEVINNYKQLLQNSVEEINGLKQKLSNRQTELKEISGDTNKQESLRKQQIEIQYKEILKLHETVSKQKSELSEFQQRINLKDEEFNRIKEQFSRQTAEFQQKLNQKEQELIKSGNDLTRYINTVKNLETQNKDYQEKLVEKEQKLTKFGNDINRHINKIGSLETQARDLREQFGQKEQELAKFSSEISRLVNNVRDLEKENQQLKPEIIKSGLLDKQKELTEEKNRLDSGKQMFKDELIVKFNEWQAGFMEENEDANIKKAELALQLKELRAKLQSNYKNLNELTYKYSRVMRIVFVAGPLVFLVLLMFIIISIFK